MKQKQRPPQPSASQQKESKMKKKKPILPYLNVRPNATLREIYAQGRKEFTAADLAKYADFDEPTIPGEQLLAELEAIHARETRKRKKK
jgi:hypothetical protein